MRKCLRSGKSRLWIGLGRFFAWDVGFWQCDRGFSKAFRAFRCLQVVQNPPVACMLSGWQELCQGVVLGIGEIFATCLAKFCARSH